MEPLYSELHSVVRDMEAEYVTAHGGYKADNPYWGVLSDYAMGVEWPDGATQDYRWTYSRMAILGGK